MKIVFTGGGTGGHFYPIIAVAQAINKTVKEQRLVAPKLYYLSGSPYNRQMLYENGIEFRRITAGKIRRYFSLKNFFDQIKTAVGILMSFWQLFFIYPDLIFSKGGYLSFPVLVAARLLKIPVFIHESDSDPGRVNLWSAKFARRIALSYPEALQYFPKDKTAVTGNPIRKEIIIPLTVGAREFLNLEPAIPVIFITGGSQGAVAINDTVIDILPDLLNRYQIIHQVGNNNLGDTQKRASVLLREHPHANRYKVFTNLTSDALQMTAGVANLVISRAGSTIFEIAQWGIPSIIIPIPEPISHDQQKNAYTYARSGGAVIIEQSNLTPSILKSEIDRLMQNPSLLEKMKAGAKSFARPDAGEVIAKEIMALALQHEE
jgi:UDP-N-acetylglucosamine--N-acetylmuramyl-(pentapeptide) pyrophosphoryl-undecaprenol N-acetylglucosamine transferase